MTEKQYKKLRDELYQNMLKVYSSEGSSPANVYTADK